MNNTKKHILFNLNTIIFCLNVVMFFVFIIIFFPNPGISFILRNTIISDYSVESNNTLLPSLNRLFELNPENFNQSYFTKEYCNKLPSQSNIKNECNEIRTALEKLLNRDNYLQNKEQLALLTDRAILNNKLDRIIWNANYQQLGLAGIVMLGITIILFIVLGSVRSSERDEIEKGINKINKKITNSLKSINKNFRGIPYINTIDANSEDGKIKIFVSGYNLDKVTQVLVEDKSCDIYSSNYENLTIFVSKDNYPEDRNATLKVMTNTGSARKLIIYNKKENDAKNLEILDNHGNPIPVLQQTGHILINIEVIQNTYWMELKTNGMGKNLTLSRFKVTSKLEPADCDYYYIVNDRILLVKCKQPAKEEQLIINCEGKNNLIVDVRWKGLPKTKNG